MTILQKKPRRFLALLVLLISGAFLFGILPAQEPENIPGLVQKFQGHEDAIYSLSFTPNGKYLITGSFDQTLKMWDTTTGKEVRTFGGPQGHKQMVLSVAISPKGHYMASGSLDKTLKLWDVPTSSPLKTLTNNEAINDVAITTDGEKVAIACKDGLVKIINPKDGKELHKLEGHTGEVKSVVFSPNNSLVGSSGVDGTIRFWNAGNGEPVSVIGAHIGGTNDVLIHPNNSLAFSVGKDGMLRFWQSNTPLPRSFKPLDQPIAFITTSPDTNQILTATPDKKIRIYNYANGQQLRELQGAPEVVTGASFNSNASQVATGLKDGKLIIWNNGNGQKEGEVQAHDGPITSVSIRPQNDQLLTSDGKGLIRIWQLPLVPSKKLEHPDEVLTLALRSDGSRVYTGGKDKNLRSWVLSNKQMERQYTGHTAPITAVAISPNGQYLVSGSEDATIRFWNQGNGQEEFRLGAYGGKVVSLAFNNANNQLVSCSEDGQVSVWQVPITEPRPLAHPDQVTSLTITPDGQRVITGCNDKNVRLWNLSNGNNERTYGGHGLPITSVAVSGNGQFVAGGSMDKSFSVWNLGNGQVVKKISAGAPVTAVALNSNGQIAAVGLSNNTIQLMEMKEGKELKKLTGHGGAISSLIYLDDNRILSASADKTLRLWDAKDGNAKATLNHVGPITALTKSKDGKLIAAGSGKTVKVWQLQGNKEVTSFETQADIRSLSFSPDNNRLVVGEADNKARVYGLDGKLVEFFSHEGPVLAVDYHSDNKRIVTAGADKQAKVWTSALVWQKEHGSPTNQVIFSPNNQVFSAGEKTVKIWNSSDGKELKSIPAHDSAVVGLGITSDSQKLATAGADKVVKVWDLGGNKVLTAISLTAVPQSLAFSPNGEKVAVGVSEGEDHLIRVFDVKTGKELQTFSDHEGAISSLAFHTDNKTLFSASADKTTQVSNVGVLTAMEHKGGVVSAQFDNSGGKFITGGVDKTVRLWEISQGKDIKTYGPVEEPMQFVAFSRDYNQIGAASGKIVRIWNVNDGKETSKLEHPAKVTSLSFNSDRSRIVTGAEDKLARVWETESNQILQFFLQEGPVPGVFFHTNNSDIIAAGDKTVTVGQLAIQRQVEASPQPLQTLAMYSNGAYIFTGGEDKEVKMWNAGNGNEERTFKGAEGTVQAIAMSKNNQMVAVGGADKTLRLYKFADAKEIKAVPTPGEILSLEFSPNSQGLVGTCKDKQVVAWDTNYPNVNQDVPEGLLEVLQTFQHEDLATAVVVANDNSHLYSSSLDKTVQVWKLASPNPIKSINHPQIVDAVAFSPDGKYFASGGHDGHIRIYDVEKQNQVRDINAHTTKNETMIYGLAFSPNSQMIVSGGYDNYLRLWNVSNGSKIREFQAYKKKDFEKGHKDSVFCVAFSPDGKYVASGSGGQERVIKIWNVSNGQVIRDLDNESIKKSPGRKEPQSHPGWVYKLEFSKDGQQLVSAGDAPRNKGYVAVWNVSNGKLLAGKEMPLGAFYSVDLSPNGQFVALAAGARGRPAPELNSAYLLKLSDLK